LDELGLIPSEISDNSTTSNESQHDRDYNERTTGTAQLNRIAPTSSVAPRETLTSASHLRHDRDISNC
jgi:hypothetical protein